MYICQFKKTTKFIFLFLAFVVIGCATKKIVLPTKRLNPTWFNGGPNYSYYTYEGNPVGHLFFDFAPSIDMQSKLVDVLITTPKGSDVHYELDLVSGRLFKERTYCAQEDIWKSYTSKIDRPNFSIGVIPRLLNRNGKPQRVMVFGDLKYLVDGKFPKAQTVQVQILGGYILKSCLRGLCDMNNNWDSEVILVAKSMLDETLQNAQGVNSLRKYVDWKYAKAFMENSMGRNEIGRLSKGAFRMESPILPTKALKFTLNTGHLFSNSELATLKNSCRKIYDDALNVFVDKENLAKNFIKYYRTEWNKFQICRKYVRHFNIQKEKDKHWKVEYLTAFQHATDMGYYYDCRNKTWVQNVRDGNGKFVVSQKKVIGGCGNREIEASFTGAISFLASTAAAGAPYYRYIEYDSGADTFNEKIYNWIWFNGKKQSCDKSEKRDIIFPTDVRLNL